MTAYALLGLLLPPLALLAGSALLTRSVLARHRRRKTGALTLHSRPLLESESGTLFGRLRSALPQYVVLSRVNLAAFLDVGGADVGSQAACRVDLARQVVDFLVCGTDFEVVAAIELDETRRIRRPHEHAAEPLRLAAIPLLRWSSANLPTVRDIQETIAEVESQRLIRAAGLARSERGLPAAALSDAAPAPRRRSSR